MKFSDYAWTIFLLAVACFVVWAGGLTRSYNAFGGEDVLGICLMWYAVWSLRKAKKEAER